MKISDIPAEGPAYIRVGQRVKVRGSIELGVYQVFVDYDDDDEVVGIELIDMESERW